VCFTSIFTIHDFRNCNLETTIPVNSNRWPTNRSKATNPVQKNWRKLSYSLCIIYLFMYDKNRIHNTYNNNYYYYYYYCYKTLKKNTNYC